MRFSNKLALWQRGEMDPKLIVRRGYDTVSFRYRTDNGEGLTSDYAAWLDELLPRLTYASQVLDLGCGCGVPVAQLLAERATVTGVDLSPVQVERARALVPNGRFLCADMTSLDFPADSFAAVVAFYAIIHVPLVEQPGLLRSIRRWLRPGGYFMATLGHTAWTGTDDDWLGAPMYWSHADADTYLRWLTDIGFDIEWTRFIAEGDGGHTLLLARA